MLTFALISSPQGKANKAAYAKLGHTLKNRAAAGGAGSEEETQLAAYRDLKDAGKKVWLEKFQMDPSLAWCQGESESMAFKSSESKRKEEWLTLEQLTDGSAVGSAQHVAWMIEDNVLESRPAECPSLRKRGVLEYKYTKHSKTVAQGVRQKAGVSASGSLSKEDYNSMVGALEGESHCVALPTSTKGKRAHTKSIDDMSPEAQAKKDKHKEVTKALSQAASIVQKVLSGVSKQALGKIEAGLADKAWAGDIKAHLEKQVTAINSETLELHQCWSHCTQIQRSGDSSVVDTSKIQAMTATALEAWKAMEKGILADIRKISSKDG